MENKDNNKNDILLKMINRIEDSIQDIQGLTRHVIERQDRAEGVTQDIYKLLYRMNEKLDRMEEKLDRMEEKQDRMEEKLDMHTGLLHKHAKMLGEHTQTMAEQSEMILSNNKEIEKLNEKADILLDGHKFNVEKLDRHENRFKKDEKIIDRHSDEIYYLNQKIK